MTSAAEETTKEVEWIMMAPGPAILLVFEAVVPVFVVDRAGLGIGEYFVCFCDFDEFLLRGGGAGVFVGVVFFG